MEEVFYCPECHQEFNSIEDLAEHTAFCEDFQDHL